MRNEMYERENRTSPEVLEMYAQVFRQQIDKVAQFNDCSNQEWVKRILGEAGAEGAEGKPMTATECAEREWWRLLEEKNQRSTADIMAALMMLQRPAKTERDIEITQAKCFNGLDQYSTSQLKAELRRRKGKKV